MSDSKPKPPIVVPLVLASVLGVGGAIIGGDRVRIPRTDSDLTRDLTELAEQLSGVVPEVSTEGFEDITEALWTHPVELVANECIVMLVAATDANFELRLVEIADTNGGDGLAQALSYCSADEAETVTFRTNSRRSLGRVLFQERRASASEDLNILTIAANWLDPEFLADRLPTELRRRALQPQRAGTGDQPLLFEVDTSVAAGAVVHPLDDAMLRAIHEAAWLGIPDRGPVEARVQDIEGNTQGTYVASIRVERSLKALIAAVDPRQYDHCVSLEVWPRQGTDPSLSVFKYPSGESAPLVDNEMRLCPDDGVVFVYGATTDYTVLLRRSDPAAHVPRVRESMTDTAAFRANVEACGAGNAESCARVAESYRTGGGVDQNAERATEYAINACEIDASRCYELALAQSGHRGHELLLRACGEGRVAIACAVLGDRYRLGEGVDADYARARAAYDRACRMGGHCATAQNLIDLQLATTEEAAEAMTALGFESVE